MPFPRFNPKPEQVSESTLAKVANLRNPPVEERPEQESESTLAKTAKPLNTPVGQRPERDSAPSLEAAKPLLNSDTSPWQEALEQAEHLAAKLVELQAPVLRVDVEGRARGYRPLKGLPPEQVHQVLRWTLEALSHQYPEPPSIAVIAQWPGAYPERTTNTPLWTWQAEHQPEPEAPPQLAPWAQAVLEGAERVHYPVLLELRDPEPETQSLSRLASSRNHLERVLGELSHYEPREARLLEPKTLEGEGYDVAKQKWFCVF